MTLYLEIIIELIFISVKRIWIQVKFLGDIASSAPLTSLNVAMDSSLSTMAGPVPLAINVDLPQSSSFMVLLTRVAIVVPLGKVA